MVRRYRHDVFICHASEDKDDVARPLAEELRGRGLDVWYDEFSLRIGDSLRQSIDKGLGASRFGVVILSPSFFQKRWPQYELDGLVNRQMQGKKVILPVWHRVGRDEVDGFSSSLGGMFAALTSEGIPAVADKIVAALPLRRGRSHALSGVSITEAGEVVAGPGTELTIAAPAARGGVAAAPTGLDGPRLVDGTTCGKCHAPLEEPATTDPAKRQPCPRCGSTTRAYFRNISASVSSSGSL